MARYRITSRDVACPRAALAAAVAGSSSSYAGLSRMIGRDDEPHPAPDLPFIDQ